MARAASPNALALRATSSSSVVPAALGLARTQRSRFLPLRGAHRVAVRAAAVAADVPGTEAPAASEVAELKAKLKEALYGTELGVRATSETRAEVAELIARLEARSPTVAPTEALSSLDGKWILVFAYTSFSQLLPLLRFGSRLPELVKVEEISQIIDSKNFTVQNCIRFSGPLATASVSTNAKFEVRSPKRVQIKFVEGVIATPHLTESIVLPEKFEMLGQNIDLNMLKAVFSSIENAASSIANTIFGQPTLKIPLRSNHAEAWLFTTYLDKELSGSREGMVAAYSCCSRREALSKTRLHT